LSDKAATTPDDEEEEEKKGGEKPLGMPEAHGL